MLSRREGLESKFNPYLRLVGRNIEILDNWMVHGTYGLARAGNPG